MSRQNADQQSQLNHTKYVDAFSKLYFTVMHVYFLNRKTLKITLILHIIVTGPLVKLDLIVVKFP